MIGADFSIAIAKVMFLCRPPEDFQSNSEVSQMS